MRDSSCCSPQCIDRARHATCSNYSTHTPLKGVNGFSTAILHANPDLAAARRRRSKALRVATPSAAGLWQHAMQPCREPRNLLRACIRGLSAHTPTAHGAESVGVANRSRLRASCGCVVLEVARLQARPRQASCTRLHVARSADGAESRANLHAARTPQGAQPFPSVSPASGLSLPAARRLARQLQPMPSRQ